MFYTHSVLKLSAFPFFKLWQIERRKIIMQFKKKFLNEFRFLQFSVLSKTRQFKSHFLVKRPLKFLIVIKAKKVGNYSNTFDKKT